MLLKNEKTNNKIKFFLGVIYIYMNYNDILVKYIDEYPCDEPIFIEDIKNHFKKYIKDNFEINQPQTR